MVVKTKSTVGGEEKVHTKLVKRIWPRALPWHSGLTTQSGSMLAHTDCLEFYHGTLDWRPRVVPCWLTIGLRGTLAIGWLLIMRYWNREAVLAQVARKCWLFIRRRPDDSPHCIHKSFYHGTPVLCWLEHNKSATPAHTSSSETDYCSSGLTNQGS